MKTLLSVLALFCVVTVAGCGPNKSTTQTDPNADMQKQQADITAEYEKMQQNAK